MASTDMFRSPFGGTSGRALATLLLLAACGSDPQTRGADSGEPQEEVDAGERPSDDRDGAASSDRDANSQDARDAAIDAGSGDAASAARGQSVYFKEGAFFTESVYDTPKSDQSDRAIAALKSRGGFGNGGVFQIDFSIDVLEADRSTSKRES